MPGGGIIHNLLGNCLQTWEASVIGAGPPYPSGTYFLLQSAHAPIVANYIHIHVYIYTLFGTKCAMSI